MKQIPLINIKSAICQSEDSMTDSGAQHSLDLSFVNPSLLSSVLYKDKNNPVLPESSKTPHSEDNGSTVKNIQGADCEARHLSVTCMVW